MAPRKLGAVEHPSQALDAPRILITFLSASVRTVLFPGIGEVDHSHDAPGDVVRADYRIPGLRLPPVHPHRPTVRPLDAPTSRSPIRFIDRSSMSI